MNRVNDRAHLEYDELESMLDGIVDLSESVGDPMDDNPSDNITRIYIQNLNGLSWNKEGGKWQYVCDVLSSIQADIACFSELNTDTNRYDVRTTMEKICHQHFEQNRLVLSSNAFKSKTTYKPGGTAILACNNISTRVQSQTRDRMGRWASLSIQISSNKKMRIISAYQVCANRTTGSNTATSHQIAQLIRERTTLSSPTQSPRQSFIHDLQAFIIQAQNNGEDIILAGDFNDDISSPQSGMQELAVACNLVDLFSHRLGSPLLPITYQRGSKRLDYALISPSLLPAVHQAGYDPFGYRIPTDHRGMYIDLLNDMIFDHKLPKLTTSTKREFKTSSPGVIKTYVTAKIQYLTEHMFFERLTVLENLVEPNHELAEKLDRDLQRASIHAAKMCSKKPRPPWSPQLARIWAEIHYYRILLSASKTQVNYRPALTKLQSAWPDLPVFDTIDPREIQTRQKQALSTLKAIRLDAQKLREEFLTKQYANALETEFAQRKRILQRIIRAETQHKVYRKLRMLRGKELGAQNFNILKIPKSISIFDVDAMKNLPDTADHWETITIPQRIEELLIARNQHHFSQADGTPFTRPPLQADIGYKADGYAAELVLSGHIQYQHVSEATNLFITHLQKRTIDTLDGFVTYNDVLNKLKNWNENTSTSPSGLHLGHYHCGWKDPRLDTSDPNRETVIQQQKMLLQSTVSLLNYTIKFGYTFERWTQIVNVMLHKDEGNPRLHRLRVIHIYEADYNLLLAVKWRQALYHAEDNSLLNDGLYGSRPGRSALDPAFMEVLQNDIYRMSMKPGINYDLDASSCYDRILVNVAVMSSRRLGLSPQVAHVNALTLEQSKYFLKTPLGKSTRWYSHTAMNPVHGTGQGSANSPTIWCFVCSALFDAFETKAHGATFSDYNNSFHVPIFMIGFVDDCTQRVNQFNNPYASNINDLITLMEQDAQLWNDLLWSSGGALEQSKCSYHLIETMWTTNGHPFLRGGTHPRKIHIAHNGHVIPTIQKSNYEAHKTLGCHINPGYTRTQPWKVLSRKNEGFSAMLDTNVLSRHEAWVFYTSIYLPSMTYPLSITPLTRQQCTQLDARLLRSLLPRCGYNRNMSRAVRYAPFNMGGAGFKEMFIEQGALVLQHVIKYLNSPTTTIGKILYMAISWTQAFLGTSKLFLTEPHYPVPPTNPSFLMDLRNYLQTIQGSIVLQDPPTPTLQRQHDRCIMDIVMEQSGWKKSHLIQINSCRRYLQAQMISDITTLRGTRILSRVFNGIQPPEPNTVRVGTFNQGRPSAQAWCTWRKFLRSICDTNGVLVQPLQKWVVQAHHCRHWPLYVYDPATDILMSHDTGPHYFLHSRLRQGCFSVRHSGIRHEVHGYPTSTHVTMDTLRPDMNFTIEASSHHYYDTSIGIAIPVQLPAWEAALLKRCQALVPDNILVQRLQLPTLITCSDGSATEDGGYYGFVVSTPTGQRLVTGQGEVPGTIHNSFRSEAYGVLATLRWLTQAYLHHTLDPLPTITHYIDNQSVIRRINKTMQTPREVPNSKLLPEQDVITEIAATLHTLPAIVTFEWVKGHQDTTLAYHRLLLPAQLNCDADAAATQASRNPYSVISPLIPAFPHTPCQLVLRGDYITSHIKRRAHESVAVPRLLEYWQQKFSWSQETCDNIDWTTYQQIIRKYKDKWTTLVKHINDISPTGLIAHRNNPLLPHECPTCGSPYETNHHMIQCRHPDRSKWRNQTINKITRYHAAEVDPYLLDILRDGVTRYAQQLDPLLTNDYPDKYGSLIRNQNLIGWDQVYKGRWSLQWAELQNQHCSQQAAPEHFSGQKWILGLGRILMDQWFLLWNQRNEARHTQENNRFQASREQLVLQELHQLYEYRLKVCPMDRHIFHSSVEAHIQHHGSLEILEEWINLYRPAIIASSEQATHLGISRNRTLLDYPTFNPVPPAIEQASLTAGSPDG